MSLPKQVNGELDMRHFNQHGFSLCYCAYCSFECNDADRIQAHLGEVHPTRLAYALVRISNAKNLCEKATIVSFYNGPVSFKFSRYTESQLNFMDPMLNCLANQTIPCINAADTLQVQKERTTRFQQNYQSEMNAANAIKKRIFFTTFNDLVQLSSKASNVATDIPIAQCEPSSSQVSQPTPTAASTTVNVATVNEHIPNSMSYMYQSSIESSARTVMDSTGLNVDQLYRCAVSNCNWQNGGEKEFLMHLSQHKCTEYACHRCQESFSMPVDLKNHLKTHIKHRFFCYYCDMTGRTTTEMDDHFNTIHIDSNFRYVPINEAKYEMEKDLFVVCPATFELNVFFKRLEKRVMALQSEKKTYLPKEIDLLPKRQIFNDEIGCGLCSYKNKCRANLVRHLKNGCNEQQAPVNPVPHLDTGERHFDKMRNLAASSNSNDAEYRLGKFIPEKDRYVCFANSCEYQNVSSDGLQQHIVTLHDTERSFSCPHCGKDLSNCNTASEMMNHLRYHDARIFKCPNCTFIHYLKQHVDKHITESHPSSKDRAIALDRSAKKDEPPKTIPTKSVSSKWTCNVCTTTFNTRAQVKVHLMESHRLNSQFACSICLLPNDKKNSLKEHLLSQHGTNDLSKIKSHYEQVECEVDNTPIWRRDDPNRVSS